MVRKSEASFAVPVEKHKSSSPSVGDQNYGSVVEVAGVPLPPPWPNLLPYFLLFTIGDVMLRILELSEPNISRGSLYGLISISTIAESWISQSPMVI